VFPEFNRHDICAAYNLFSQSWGWDAYTHGIQARLTRLRYRDPGAETLEDLTANAKAIYGRLERRHHGDAVAYNRLHRRRPDVFPPWPGTQNVGSYAGFLRKRGMDPACLDLVAPAA
jgi:hypothetical protein